MAISEEQKNAGDKTSKGYGLFSIIMGSIMLWQGHKHMDSCPNGAAWWLYIAGILILVTNLIGLVMDCAQTLAEKDGKISCGEQCGLGILTFAKGGMALVNFAIIIWGSVVVFGAWASWSYEVADAGKENFCPYTPMMCAFVVLIIYWVLLPIIFTCICFAGVCAICTKAVSTMMTTRETSQSVRGSQTSVAFI